MKSDARFKIMKNFFFFFCRYIHLNYFSDVKKEKKYFLMESIYR